MEKFVQAKTLQETWCPPATSTPSNKTEKQEKQDMVNQVLEQDKSEIGDVLNETEKDLTGENTEEKRYKTKNLIESMSSINVLLKEICDGMIKKKKSSINRKQ